jgi:hypothetical protein
MERRLDAQREIELRIGKRQVHGIALQGLESLLNPVLQGIAACQCQLVWGNVHTRHAHRGALAQHIHADAPNAAANLQSPLLRARLAPPPGCVPEKPSGPCAALSCPAASSQN